MNKEIKEHIDNLINNFNNMSYREQQEELFELYKTGEVEYVDVVDKFSNSVKKYKRLQDNWNELKELLKQPVPTYASAIKLLDEIERIIESRK